VLCCYWDLSNQQNAGLMVLMFVRIEICQRRSIEAHESEIGSDMISRDP